MKSVFNLFVLLGVSGSLAAQSVNVKKDTTVWFPGGGVLRIQSSYSSGFSDIIEDFGNTRRRIVNQAASNYADERARIKQRREEEAARLKRFIENQRIATFTNIIGLTAKESEKFWPVYNEYSEKLDAIMAKRQDAIERINDIHRKIPVWEQNMLTEDYLNSFQHDADLMRNYRNKFKAILGPEKLMLLYRAEYQFKLYLLRMCSE
ncbi:MAG: hypothetical protein LBC98_02235 [Prevotellaceae bacterium]|jgi:hypothetical protein|nr:hypothetical protein [Prevotellaceae bacterium]